MKKKAFYFIIFFILLINLNYIYSNTVSNNTKKSPSRIISISPAVTEAIYLLKADHKLIANTTYCVRPEQAKHKEKIGNLLEINVEKIITLRPDIIICTTMTNPKDVEKIKKFGIKILTLSYAKNFEEICNHFLKIGEIVGEKKTAEKIIKKAKQEVENIKNKFLGLPKKKVFVQIGAKPLFTITKDSFINDFIEFSGGINIAKDAKSGLYSREKVIGLNPDIIIIATMGIVGEGEKKVWEKYSSLNAAKNNRIHIVDSYLVCNPNIFIFVKALKKIAGILHPGP